MTLLIDAPAWPAHGTRWSHLISNRTWREAVGELTAFAHNVGLDPRFFDGDHQDVPADRYADCVAAGAVPATGRELAAVLHRTQQRLPKRKRERCLARQVDGLACLTGAHLLDVVRSPHPPPAATTRWAGIMAPTGAGAAQLRAFGGDPGTTGGQTPSHQVLPYGYGRVWLPQPGAGDQWPEGVHHLAVYAPTGGLPDPRQQLARPTRDLAGADTWWTPLWQRWIDGR